MLVVYPVFSFSQNFSDKIFHSFGVQNNHCIYPKWEAGFRHQDEDNTGWEPLISYGNEFLLKYNITFPVGMGITLEGVYCLRSFFMYDRLVRTYAYCLGTQIHSTNAGFNLKTSYSKVLTSWLTIQPELGLKMVYYFKRDINFSQSDIDGNIHSRMYFDNFSFGTKRHFIPDLTTGINFLFHSSKNRRHNFIIGFNANFSFITRFKGYYSVTPTDLKKHDCDIKYNCSYFGISLGYEFSGFPKSSSKLKRRAKYS
jgi:hypothetical protein